MEHTNGRELFLKLETTPLQPQVLKIPSQDVFRRVRLTAEKIYTAQRLPSHGSGKNKTVLAYRRRCKIDVDNSSDHLTFGRTCVMFHIEISDFQILANLSTV